MPFKGYFQPGDPRGPCFASSGADWPTVPAFRYRLGSEDASGSWSFLKTTGVLLEHAQSVGKHTDRWAAIADAPPCFSVCVFERMYLPIIPVVSWRLRIVTPCQFSAWICRVFKRAGPANVDVELGGIFTPNGPPGDAGTKLTAYQVEFDETQPPGGWPPW